MGPVIANASAEKQAGTPAAKAKPFENAKKRLRGEPIRPLRSTEEAWEIVAAHKSTENSLARKCKYLGVCMEEEDIRQEIRLIMHEKARIWEDVGSSYRRYIYACFLSIFDRIKRIDYTSFPFSGNTRRAHRYLDWAGQNPGLGPDDYAKEKKIGRQQARNRSIYAEYSTGVHRRDPEGLFYSGVGLSGDAPAEFPWAAKKEYTTPEDELAARRLKDKIAGIVDGIPNERDRDICRMLFWAELKGTEIAEIYGVSGERISQIKERVQRYLKRQFESEGIGAESYRD